MTKPSGNTASEDSVNDTHFSNSHPLGTLACQGPARNWPALCSRKIRGYFGVKFFCKETSLKYIQDTMFLQKSSYWIQWWIEVSGRVQWQEHRSIDASDPWCWGRLLRVPCTARRSNPSILKEISPGCSLEGLMLKLKLQYFGHLLRRADSLGKTLMLGGIGGRRRKGWQRMRWHHRLDGHEFEWTPGVGDGQGGLGGPPNSWSRKELDMTELNRTVIGSVFRVHLKLTSFIKQVTSIFKI